MSHSFGREPGLIRASPVDGCMDRIGSINAWRRTLAVVLIACSCQMAAFTAEPHATPLAGLIATSWLAEDIGGSGVLDGVQSTLSFESETRVAGSTGCNRYFGRVQLSGMTLHFETEATTRRACTPAIMDQEQRFLAVLNAASTYRHKGDTLSLLNDAGHELVRFKKMDATTESNAPTSRTVFTSSGPVGPLSAYAFDCANGPSFVMRMVGTDEIELVLTDSIRHLVHERTASGARYSDGRVSVWNKGREASLELSGKTYPCMEDRARSIREDARARGVEFRGSGNEPGWVLEVLRDRVVFAGDYGKSLAITPHPIMSIDPTGRTTVYTAVTEAHWLQVRVEDRRCIDSMSGEQYNAQVEVELDDDEYRGCGYTP